jgi:hypothetical protein
MKPTSGLLSQAAINLRRPGGKKGSCHHRNDCGGALPAECKRWRCGLHSKIHPARQVSSKGKCSYRHRLQPICNSQGGEETCQPFRFSFILQRISKSARPSSGGEDPNSFCINRISWALRTQSCVQPITSALQQAQGLHKRHVTKMQ